MKTIRFVLVLIALCGASLSLHAAGPVSVRGLLVSASSEKGEVDSRLSAYAGNLKRILRAESLRLVGEDSTTLAVPANETLSLSGQSVQLSTESVDGKTVLVKARWGSARQDYVVQRGGGTTLLVGYSGKNGDTQAVLLITK